MNPITSFKQRDEMDYEYFEQYSVQRVLIQDCIIQNIFNAVPNLDCVNPRPRIIFTAGPFGAGKSRTLRWLNEQGELDLRQFVFIDPDQIKRSLPEWPQYISEDPLTAATRLHKESTFIALLTERIALSRQYNIIVDGSLQNTQWYKEWFVLIKQQYPMYQIEMIRVHATLDNCKSRCDKRARETGRHIPLELLTTMYTQCQYSFEQLRHDADLVLEYDNNNNTIPILLSHSSFQSSVTKINSSSITNGLQEILLVACGSYSPVTMMHLLLFEQARNYLQYETQQFNVIGGILSPVHDAYGKASLIPAAHRVRMCELAVEDSTWLSSNSWETMQSAYTPTAQTLLAFKTLYHSWLTNKPQIMLLCGADLLESTLIPKLWSDEDLHTIFAEFGVVVIERIGLDLQQIIATSPLLTKWKHHIYIVPQRIVNTISSTIVRQLIHTKQSIKYLVPDKTIQYILNNHLYQ